MQLATRFARRPAAWIVEKFREWADPLSSIPIDTILTSVTLSWDEHHGLVDAPERLASDVVTFPRTAH